MREYPIRAKLGLIVIMLLSGSCSLLFGSSGKDESSGSVDSGPLEGADSGITADPLCNAECVQAGGSCDTRERCVLECVTDPCICPEGHSCVLDIKYEADIHDVDCTKASFCDIKCDDSCHDTTIECGDDCEVHCLEDFSCSSVKVFCGTGDCKLNCTYDQYSCQNADVVCDFAETCDVDCSVNACEQLLLDCDSAASCSASCPEDGAITCDGARLECANTLPENCDMTCNANVSVCQVPSS